MVVCVRGRQVHAEWGWLATGGASELDWWLYAASWFPSPPLWLHNGHLGTLSRIRHTHTHTQYVMQKQKLLELHTVKMLRNRFAYKLMHIHGKTCRNCTQRRDWASAGPVVWMCPQPHSLRKQCICYCTFHTTKRKWSPNTSLRHLGKLIFSVIPRNLKWFKQRSQI